MKKITLTQKMIAGLLFLSSAMSYAQYCDPADDFDYVGEGLVEEITNVTFAGTSFSNTDNSVILVDMTSTTVNVSPGASYTFSVQGNAYGDYANQYALFIDWDGDFDLYGAEDEGYYIGQIIGSTGQDDLFATNTITVPETVSTGTVTRARIVKAYVDPGFVILGDPCAVAMYNAETGQAYYSFGQALDFTVNVVTASVDNHLAGSFSVYPNPAKDILNISNSIGAEINSVTVSDINGRTVKQVTANGVESQINIADLNAGVYFVNITSTEGSLTKKIVKQ